jgi:TPR repeat protein
MSKRILAIALVLCTMAFLAGPARSATPEDILAQAWMAYNLGRYQRTLELLMPLAQDGNPRAQVLVGRCYENGLGVEEDASQAAQWYLLASEKQDREAEVLLAYCYEQGTGVDKDPQAAVRLMSSAARAGYAEAQYNMALYYNTGRNGLPQSDEECFRWAERAANQGYAQAELLVGACYEHGIGVEQNAGLAQQWYARAAAQGLAKDGAIFSTSREYTYPK